jgi:hypothetical protein
MMHHYILDEVIPQTKHALREILIPLYWEIIFWALLEML